MLLRRFSDDVTAATLGALLFGTGLYHYATFDSSYSHAYSFFLLGVFLWGTDWWHEDRLEARDSRLLLGSILLGVVAGLIVLTRHTNALFLLVFPLYGVTNGASLRAVAAACRRDGGSWRSWSLWATVVITPQLAIYYQATGRVFVSSYGELSFDVPLAASLGRSLQRAEGTVLLVAASARRGRRLCRR